MSTPGMDQTSVESEETDLLDRLGKAKAALDSATSQSKGLWFTFLSVCAYLTITIGAVTHRDLLLANPLKLPLIDIGVPMGAFFWIAPILLILIHAYLLLHLKLMADNIRDWEQIFQILKKKAAMNEFHETELRMQLPNYLLVQSLSGVKFPRQKAIDISLSLVIVSTVVLFPMAILLMTLIQFLPYQSEILTWTHRSAIVTDIVLLFFMWPMIMTPAGAPARNSPLAYFAAFLTIWFSTVIATFPGETMHHSSGLGISWMREKLFEGKLNEVNGRPTSIFSNRVVITHQRLVDIDEGNSPSIDPVLSLRGRRLNYAVFVGSDLRRADFSAASLIGADFSFANLDGAIFDRTWIDVTWRNLGGPHHVALADLRGSSFLGAKLNGASFWGAELQGSQFWGSEMRGVILDAAILTPTFMFMADLTGASLKDTQLDASYLSGANFSGARIENAMMDAGVFNAADFTAATIINTKMRQASGLDDATWTGVSMYNNEMEGTVYKTEDEYKFLPEYLKIKLEDTDRVDDVQRQLRELWRLDSDYSEERSRLGKRLEQFISIGNLEALYPSDRRWISQKIETRIKKLLSIYCGASGAAILNHRGNLPGDSVSISQDDIIGDLGPYSGPFARALRDKERCPELIGLTDRARILLSRISTRPRSCEIPLPTDEPRDFSKPLGCLMTGRPH
ncbi:pentapeptide repeat-containing protein [Rhizobium leguminosarum]|uniref:pentapeptide repeat-containing protein n=1 Tax=Rhizobium leguminosarum TaxID=384 RepID=UPI001C904804|nr:pentapeptide repeat-containing protein [Rhizobium leguminosarum]MBY2919649.1 pentapeptide repeat-containing protein [Rhizobium leguminosarum]MBY2975348.1 pentapeptide repeat-containing protein [Rhizobium leguminosarum]MBY2981880.1 pentapeptide repeat-containing protein [Rhizobium leguminosarum]MBY3011265.1 pentapeptide repeat-containing protein [Rhizobium leguminosarum]